MRLRDGTETEDPRLGRLKSFDPRSLQYPIRALLPDKPLRSYTWSCRTYLDQGQEGACVGFSWAHELAARPKVHQVDTQLARALYKQAQELDEWPGSDYEGTSVLAGAKAVQRMGLMGEYRWAFGLLDAVRTLGYHGPVVLGINWTTGMWDTNPEGYVHATGSVVGGHAILANAVSLKREAVRLHNSWGHSWGVGGEAWLSFTDLEKLLREDGECCVPVDRRTRSVQQRAQTIGRP